MTCQLHSQSYYARVILERGQFSAIRSDFRASRTSRIIVISSPRYTMRPHASYTCSVRASITSGSMLDIAIEIAATANVSPSLSVPRLLFALTHVTILDPKSTVVEYPWRCNNTTVSRGAIGLNAIGARSRRRDTSLTDVSSLLPGDRGEKRQA